MGQTAFRPTTHAKVLSLGSPAQTVLMLVEDEPADVALFRRCLPAALGKVELVHHRGLRDAMAWLRDQRCDVAVVDLGLPDATGDEAVVSIRNAAPDVPLIVLTDDEMEGAAERVLREGAEDYLPKSHLDSRTLRRVTRHAVERARLRTQAARQAEQVGRLERQALDNERLAAVGRIAAGVAHEINNPAAFISANLESSRAVVDELEETLGVDHEAVTTLRECIEESAEGINRIATIVKDLRTFSRVDDDEVQLVRLDDVVDSAYRTLAGHLMDGVRVQRTSDRPPAIGAVRGKLVQVVTNLMTNAVSAMEEVPRGSRVVQISVGHDDEAAWVKVVDNGRGIAPAIRHRVFEPFFTTKGAQGTGLGLTLSSEIARAHSGSLQLAEVDGPGVGVVLRLPLDTGLRPPPLRAVNGPPLEGRPRVLLVDDEPLVRLAVARVLAKSCDVAVAADGREALECLSAEPEAYDAVLCDLAMPDIDGPELYRQVCKNLPQLRERFVFLTGGAFTAESRAFVAASRAKIVSKPARRVELVEAIRGVSARPPVDAGRGQFTTDGRH